MPAPGFRRLTDVGRITVWLTTPVSAYPKADDFRSFGRQLDYEIFRPSFFGIIRFCSQFIRKGRGRQCPFVTQKQRDAEIPHPFLNYTLLQALILQPWLIVFSLLPCRES